MFTVVTRLVVEASDIATRLRVALYAFRIRARPDPKYGSHKEMSADSAACSPDGVYDPVNRLLARLPVGFTREQFLADVIDTARRRPAVVSNASTVEGPG
jgi:hypothetical protein